MHIPFNSGFLFFLRGGPSWVTKFGISTHFCMGKGFDSLKMDQTSHFETWKVFSLPAYKFPRFDN